jgi:hypothetical protein
MNKQILRGAHCQCGVCKEYFNSVYAFDRHRTGEHGKSRRCLTIPEMGRLGMERNTGGWWISQRMRQTAIPSLTCDSRSGDQS